MEHGPYFESARPVQLRQSPNPAGFSEINSTSDLSDHASHARNDGVMYLRILPDSPKLSAFGLSVG
jgi:hypothetical protein